MTTGPNPYAVPGGYGIPAGYAVPAQPYARQPQPAAPVMTPQQIREKIRSDLNVAKETINLFSESLGFVDPNAEDVKSNELITGAAPKCFELELDCSWWHVLFISKTDCRFTCNPFCLSAW